MDRLEAQVEAVQSANKYANEIHAKLVEIFRDFVGKKITKKNGDLLESVSKLVPVFRQDKNLNVYRQTSSYGLTWVVKTCVFYEEEYETCVYHETVVCVGNLHDQVLSNVYDEPDRMARKTDYDVSFIRSERERYKILQDQADEVKSNLYPFDVR